MSILKTRWPSSSVHRPTIGASFHPTTSDLPQNDHGVWNTTVLGSPICLSCNSYRLLGIIGSLETTNAKQDFHLGMYVNFQHTCSNFLILKSLVQLKSWNISTPNDWTKDLSWNNKLFLDVLSWVLYNQIGPDSKNIISSVLIAICNKFSMKTFI